MHDQVVILDVGGVLTVETGYIPKLGEFEIPLGVIPGLELFRDNNFQLALAINQPGIGRGLCTEDQMYAFIEKLSSKMDREGIEFRSFAFCPHVPSDNCKCRKPKTGLLDWIESDMGPINWECAYGIGDRVSDSQMILAKGGYACLLENGSTTNKWNASFWTKGDPDVRKLNKNPRHAICKDFFSAANWIVSSYISNSAR